jgi:hypothetical protein
MEHHGHTTHTSTSPEYSAWVSMKQRCNNPKHPAYKHYGGRGIRVCVAWAKSFGAFLKDMGCRPNKNLSLERKNNNGNYEPRNCKWATRSEQRRNMRQKEACKYGHLFDDSNVHMIGNERVCLECRRKRTQKYRKRHRTRYLRIQRIAAQKRRERIKWRIEQRIAAVCAPKSGNA